MPLLSFFLLGARTQNLREILKVERAKRGMKGVNMRKWEGKDSEEEEDEG